MGRQICYVRADVIHGETFPAESGTLPHRPWTTMSLVNGRGPQAKRCGRDEAKRKSVRKRLPLRGSRCGTIGRDCRSAGVFRGVLPLRSAVHYCRCEALELTEREQTHKKEDDHCGHPHTEKINWISAIWLRGCPSSRPGRAGPE